ncbi:MAG: hypothetical protein WCS55_04690 [Sulfuricurvum sp.]|uniref:hypothetical protein n=1 Tax=Sulfuricurvum sp. TaxID=2025608 RepID=UPI00356A4D89
MSEFNITVKVEKRTGVFRPFHEEIGTAKLSDGREMRLLSTIPQRNIMIEFEGADYEITSQDIVNAVMNKIINTEGESDG